MKLEMKTGLYTDVSNDDYHSDRTMVSNSWLTRVGNATPFHLHRYLNEPYVKTLALIIGSAVDCLIFEPEVFDESFARGPDASKSSKAGKEEWAQFNADNKGKDVLTIHTAVNYWDQAHLMADAIRANPVMAEYLNAKGGVAQPVYVWQDEITGLWCKLKLDWAIPDEGIFIDLKTTVDASPLEFSKSVANFRYHVQEAFYSEGLRANGVTVNDFLFAAMEKPAKTQAPDPRMLAFYRLSEDDKMAGQDTFESDLAAINFALSNEVWEGYANTIVEITRPTWAKQRDQ